MLFSPALTLADSSGDFELSINKTVKNLSKGTDWQDSVQADPNDILSFQIEVTLIAEERVKDIWLTDKLPNRIYYEGNFMADGIRSSWDILGGFNLGYLNPGQKRVFTFDAKVAAEKNFDLDTTANLVNTASVWAHQWPYEEGRAEDTATVNVYRAPLPQTQGTFSVTNLVRNISKDTDWLDSVKADAGEKISFSIRIEATGTAPAKDIVVQDGLPVKIVYRGNLKIDGVSSSGNILSGLTIGELSPGQSKTITFDAEVFPAESFIYGTTYLKNAVSASNIYHSFSDTAEVVVERQKVAGATDVITGFTNNKVLDYLLLPLAMTLLFLFLFSKNFVLVSDWFEGRRNSVVEFRSERNFKRAVAQVKSKEVLPK